jgi:coenzyme F420-reducing hydrogenase alpha subunit
MPTITLDPLPWQDMPARITVHANHSHLAVYYQVTSPVSAQAVCRHRPVEELPRIVSILAPSHHLTAALALDRLFQVDPPEPAQNMRTALLQSHYCTAHLRKFFFLMTTVRNPLADFPATGLRVNKAKSLQHWVEKTMHHLALSLEAEDILGGRHDHPLTAVTGGVSRYLKQAHYRRLTDLCETLLPFACELAQLIRNEFLPDGGILSQWKNFEIPAMPGLSLADGKAVLTPADGSGGQHFNTEQLGDVIAMQQENWTFQPFAYLKDKGWQGIEQSDGLFFVGPLARFNTGRAADTPLAEEERGRMMEAVGTPPVNTVAAAFCAMAVELIQTVEMLAGLSSPEKLAGPALRTVPVTKANSTWAALESPQGMSWHQYQVDPEGIVQSATIIDAHAANNALKCRLASQLVHAAMERKENPGTIKKQAAVALLPF